MYTVKTLYVCPHCKKEYTNPNEAMSCESRHRTEAESVFCYGEFFKPATKDTDYMGKNTYTHETYPILIKVRFRNSNVELIYKRTDA